MLYPGDDRNILKVYVAGRESFSRPPRAGTLKMLFLVEFEVHAFHMRIVISRKWNFVVY